MREGKLRFRGGRGEAATYEGPDEEDEEAEAAINAEIRQRFGDDDEEDGGNVNSDKQQQQAQHSTANNDDASESVDEEDDERNTSRAKTADRAKLLAAAAAVAKRLGRSAGPTPKVATSTAAAGDSGERKRRTAKTAGDDLIKAAVVEINGRMQCEIQVGTCKNVTLSQPPQSL